MTIPRAFILCNNVLYDTMFHDTMYDRFFRYISEQYTEITVFFLCSDIPRVCTLQDMVQYDPFRCKEWTSDHFPSWIPFSSVYFVPSIHHFEQADRMFQSRDKLYLCFIREDDDSLFSMFRTKCNKDITTIGVFLKKHDESIMHHRVPLDEKWVFDPSCYYRSSIMKMDHCKTRLLPPFFNSTPMCSNILLHSPMRNGYFLFVDPSEIDSLEFLHVLLALQTITTTTMASSVIIYCPILLHADDEHNDIIYRKGITTAQLQRATVFHTRLFSDFHFVWDLMPVYVVHSFRQQSKCIIPIHNPTTHFYPLWETSNDPKIWKIETALNSIHDQYYDLRHHIIRKVPILSVLVSFLSCFSSCSYS